MKENRAHRLNILQCFLDISPSVSRDEECLKCYDPSMKEIVCSWSCTKEVISGLRAQDAVSYYYTESCLLVDFWYLLRDTNFSPGPNRNCPSIVEPEGRLLFQVTFESLLDLHIGRPCDAGMWRKDISPDFKNCTDSIHVCWNSAEKYLLSISSEGEQYMGLSTGSLKSLVHEMKKDKIFSISSLIFQEKINQI
jgi:hypothetical protein